ncbi:MAG: hypothetical protein KGJ89_03715 [Patescibacteria group bacterium]|nr:hypothetical protein [Patescibacteria group bacterium]MDE2015231.1 hypothetical protein [Patescibacteria group bacterium]MDE2227037.1 hypothetical protein [Patescibacteria group bacterium]
MYYPESSIITTKDGLHCQIYMSDHPRGLVIVKPKYIPTDKISSSALPLRYIHGRKLNRLNMWISKERLKKYLADFKRAYPDYVHFSKNHGTWFFAVPEKKIERVYDSRKGLQELMKMPAASLDGHLRNVMEFVKFLKRSGVPLKDFGLTYSTLVGHYFLGISDINIVVYGKKNFWKVIGFLEKAKHPNLRFKTDKEWIEYHKKRGRTLVLNKKEFLFHSRRKKWEGFWNGNLFLILGVEKPNEVSVSWNKEKYKPLGIFKVHGKIKSDHHSGVRPGLYEIENGKVLGKKDEIPLKYIVFFTRNFAMQAKKGENVEAQGLLESSTDKDGKEYYRLVLGYFDSFLSGRNKKEYLKVLK